MKKIFLFIPTIVLVFLVAQEVFAESVVIRPAQLSTIRAHLSCAEDTSTGIMYCFGGERSGGAYVADIMEYNPFTENRTVKQSLPSERRAASCIENSLTHTFLCFGGSGTDQIVEYNPRTNNVSIKTTTLQGTREGLSCTEDTSTHLIYCFGGSFTDDIVEYNPFNDSLKIEPAKLPVNLMRHSCDLNVANNKIYCFGGQRNVAPFAYDGIVEYDLKTKTVTVKSAKLPSVRGSIACTVIQGTDFAYCLGGAGSNVFDEIIEYDISADNISVRPVRLPSPRHSMGCTTSSFNRSIFCFGGETGGGLSAEIIEYVTRTLNFNLPPTLNPIGNQTINENETLTIQLIATDPENNTLTFSTNATSILPSPFSFNQTSGLFVWTPTFADSGSYEVTFTVSDKFSSDSETITIMVNNINLPPTLNPIGNKVTTENQALAFTLTAADPDNDPLTFATNAASTLPSPFTFDTQTGNFSWTPSYVEYGQYQVTFNVTDGEFTDSETITIDVLDAQTAVVSMVGAAKPGNRVTFFLSDPAATNQFYMLAFSLGNTPGFTLSDGRHVPLNPDSLFFTSLLYPIPIGLENSLGLFGSTGNAVATWDIPNNPVLSGFTVHAGMLTLDNTLPAPKSIISISPSISFTIQ